MEERLAAVKHRIICFYISNLLRKQIRNGKRAKEKKKEGINTKITKLLLCVLAISSLFFF